MYHKIKNTLAGLGFVAAFVAGGLLFSEPVPASRGIAPIPAPAAATAEAETALAMALVRTRLQTVMPYYSFGATLRRTQES
jgi:hypothetical protein